MKLRWCAASSATLAGLTLISLAHVCAAQQAVTVPAAPAPSVKSEPTRAPELAPDDFAQDARVINALSRTRAALDKREHELEQRAAQVAAAEQLARREIGQLASLRTEVQKMVDQQTRDANGDLDKMAGLFSSMKPVQAAAILGKLDVPKAAAIIRRLDARMAGPVLAAMDPAAAAGVTLELQRVHAAFQN